MSVLCWEEASLEVGGDGGDDAFLLELLSILFEDGLQHILRLLRAAQAHRRGARELASPHGARPLLVVMRDEAHAIKGSAANLRLSQLLTDSKVSVF